MKLRTFSGCLVLLLFALAAAAQTDCQQARQSTSSEVHFASGGVTLAGTLMRPAGNEPVPALVFVHGSGPVPREVMLPFAERFVRDGFAVLLFDKRGTGGSGGDWTAMSLDDLADDVNAAAAFLKTRKEIDSRRVGLWGVSQAGWVIPHAIARAPEAYAFAVSVTGGGVTPLELERYDYSAALHRAQVSDDDHRQAMALVDRYFNYLRTGQDRDGLISAIHAVDDRPWARALNLGRVLPSTAAQSKWSWVPTYDPAGDIAQVKIPILVVLGGQDRPELAATAESNWRTALAKAGNQDATVLIFAAAGHGITIGGHHVGGAPNRFAPGYLEMVDAWLESHRGK